jgi:hypothetical protein
VTALVPVGYARHAPEDFGIQFRVAPQVEQKKSAHDDG